MGYHCYIWMPLFYGWFVFQHLDDMDGIPSKKNNLLGPRGFDARPFASKYARCRRSGQVLWVSGSFLSHGVTPVIIQTKMTISVRIKTHDPTGDSQFFFFDKNRPKLDFCGHPNDGTCDPLRFSLDDQRHGAVDTSWCSIAVETITILTAQFDNVHCELSFRSYYQYRMSCPTEPASMLF